MISSPAQRRLSTLLAAIYLIVGATGDSLHYLVESPADSGSAGATHGPHFHDHGDGLWHHHGDHAVDVLAAAAESSSDRTAAGEPIVAPDDASRHDHTCLLLAIAKAIELSQPAARLPLRFQEAVRLVGLRDGDSISLVGLANLGPRGPPMGGAA